ncbi:ubiquitin carboxyl-terminal hydrolase 2-like [Pollicipes pollicipes]|nr:ubiquitin carboxyl-terminal hydrolase 2-like isoform X2 [Pollicipes pollicipes]XP_037090499.1 ubiquitin carboxyl-terminal hydrolase 2-like [Pollicipes pollicipes]
MNSVLQCLSNTRALHDYILRDEYSADINTTTSSMKGALIRAFATLMSDLWKKTDQADVVLTTAPFKSQIQRFAPRFMGYQQQDAQEFLRYLLEGLHEDVNRVTSRPRPITTDIDDSLSTSQQSMEAWKRFLRLENSKFVDLFVGQLKSTLRCTVCGHASVTFDPFWDLSLPIPSKTGQVRLQACFDLFTKEEVLDGDEKPTCAKCQKRQRCTKGFSIQKFPRILVVHLKRFSPQERFRGKLGCAVDFPVSGLDLSPYSAGQGPCKYNLYGVANHSGTLFSGHYTAYCQHPLSGDWYEYNDSRVRPISSRTVSSSEAYVLFFELAGSSHC